MNNQSQRNLVVSPPSLQKGGGAIRTIQGALGAAGPDGACSFNLPLPITSGRGLSPELALQYSSGAGNGVFGIGWQLPVLSIARRSNRGVPLFTEDDEFVGPDGEVLVAHRNANGELNTRVESTYGDKALDQEYLVTRYLPRVEADFNLIEYWQVKTDEDDSFWLVHGSDGSLHCLGKTPEARIANAKENNARIAQWFIEETVSPTGEHVCYTYQKEDDKDGDTTIDTSRTLGALCYLVQVDYGNLTPAKHLYAWDDAETPDWLFSLVFDYGERSLDAKVVPPMHVNSYWRMRKDPFSGYHFGYETRCLRLCRQVLMYHHFSDELGEENTLVQRLILEYNENALLTQLRGVHAWAYGEDDSAMMQPPLDLSYTSFNAKDIDAASWQSWAGLPGLNTGHPFQLVDLYGEGIPGVLYQGEQGWHYRGPVRGDNDDDISYAPWQSVPQLPSMQNQGQLLDLNGNGKLDWVVAIPGVAGCFSLNPDKTWSAFTPFSALPSEFFHPQAQLADLVGDGLSDLTLIGPNSVRFYANQRTGFESARDIKQADGIMLPVAGRDAQTLVAFSDLLGSGQAHLVKISQGTAQCWPNLGRGMFDTPINFSWEWIGESGEAFNPDQLYLADLDGSGANDLIYVHHDRLAIYANQAGNSFAEPRILPFPDNVVFDQLSQLSIADMQGNGTASLLLTTSYPTARHWRLDFCEQKPYLLNGVNNNIGADTQWVYRSSAQYWLDEKQADANAICHLPLTLPLLSRTTSTDEITGNTLSQEINYAQGFYDGKEREFRGYVFVETKDVTENSKGTGYADSFSPSLVTRTWYHSGREESETALLAKPWNGDQGAYTLPGSRLTTWKNNADVLLSDVDDETKWWLYRGLKGRILRQEVFGEDATPYGVTSYRYQVRVCQVKQANSSPVIYPALLETLSYRYECISDDPQCNQSVVLATDQYGFSQKTVAISYPRRAYQTPNQYPDDLPNTSVESSYDAQQNVLRFAEQRQTYHHLEEPDAWLLGVPAQSRLDHLTDDSPQGTHYSYEALIAADSPLVTLPRTFGGQQCVVYKESTPTALPVLVDHTESAEYDQIALKAYDCSLSPKQLTQMLHKGGYIEKLKILGDNDNVEDTVWVTRQGFSDYDSTHFYLPKWSQNTLLTGKMTYTYNGYGLLTKTTDALNNEVTITAFNYRTVQPSELLDANKNTQAVKVNALGQVIAMTGFGSEKSETVGFASFTDTNSCALTVSDLIENGISADKQAVAARFAYDAFSWMGQISKVADQDWSALIEQGLIVVSESDINLAYIRSSGHCWASDPANKDNPYVTPMLQAVRAPVHSASVAAARYPDDPEPQQKPIAIIYNDGFGRARQSVMKDVPGEAYCTTNAGEFVLDNSNQPTRQNADPRWAISGQVEYDSKGQMVRVYQPYFANNWRYIVDNEQRDKGYADLHYYDALGRESKVEVAAGFYRQTRHFPWFTVAEDENDTLTDQEAL